MKAAAESPEAMLRTMKSYTRAEIQQPRAAHEFANLLWCMMRGKDRLGILDALLHPAISLPVLTPYQSRALEAGLPLPFPGGRGPVGSPWEHMDVPGWDRKLDGDRGPGLFAQKRLEHGDLAGLYVGVDCETAEFPPGRSNVSLTHNPDGRSPASCVIGELPLSVLEEKRGAGVLFNAGDTTAKANLRLDRRNVWRDGKGLAYMAFYVLAKQGIEPGEGGYWRYDPFSGIGGAESYTFNDGKYRMSGIGDIQNAALAGEEEISSSRPAKRWHGARASGGQAPGEADCCLNRWRSRRCAIDRRRAGSEAAVGVAGALAAPAAAPSTGAG
jgi:hypothetical protein